MRLWPFDFSPLPRATEAILLQRGLSAVLHWPAGANPASADLCGVLEPEDGRGVVE